MVNDIYYRCHNNLSFIPPARSQEDLRLSLSEAEEDVECWFSHNPDGGAAQGLSPGVGVLCAAPESLL